MSRRFQGFRFIVFLSLLFCLISSESVYAQEVDLENLMEKDIDDLMDIYVISASKSIEKIHSVPATVRIITNEQIRDRGYFYLDDVLADLPGFQFRNIQGFNSYIFLRGLPNQNNLIHLMINGVQINELNSGGFYSGAQYNLANVDRIEVVYGPSSALYGTNAISGIINIITKSPENNSGLSGSLLLGSFNTVSVEMGYGAYDKEQQMGIRVAGMVNTTDKADLGGEEGDFNWSDDPETFDDSYSFEATALIRNLKLNLVAQKKSTAKTTFYRSTGTDTWDHGTIWNIIFFNGLAEYTHCFSDNSSVTTRLYYRNATVENDTINRITDSWQEGYYRPNSMIGLESLWHYKSEHWNITNGLVFEFEELSTEFSRSYSSSPYTTPSKPAMPQVMTNNLASFFSQISLKLTDLTDLIVGARFDSSSIYDDVLTPRVGLVNNWEHFNLKLLYTEAFRAPKPWDYTVGLGNPELEPESMTSLELSASLSVTDSLRIDVAIFNNSLEDLFVSENRGDSFRWVNLGKVDTTGIEVNTEFHMQNWKSYFNYSYTVSEDESGNQIPEISRHTANAGALFSITEGIKVNLRANYIGERTNPQPYTNKGATIIDDALIFYGTVTVELSDRTQLVLASRNLLDTTYYHTSNRPVSRYRQPQRAFMCSLRFEF